MNRSINSTMRVIPILAIFFAAPAFGQTFSIPADTVEVYDDETSIDGLTRQTDFDDVNDRKLTVRWNYTGNDVYAWHIYVKKNDGGFFYLNAVDVGASFYTWNNPDVNTQFEFRVWGLRTNAANVVLNQRGPMGYNLDGGEAVKLKKIANPSDLPAQTAIVVDDLFHSTDLSNGEDVDGELESAIALKFNPGEGDFYDVHVQVSVDGQNFVFLGQTGAADIYFFRFDGNRTFLLDKAFQSGPQNNMAYWFRVFALRKTGSPARMDAGPINFSIDQSTLWPTPTPTPIPPTPTPTPIPTISLSGKVSYLINSGDAVEGDPVAGAEVSLIPALYNVSDATNESAILSTVSGGDGSYSLILSATTESFRLRVSGKSHYLHVGAAFSPTASRTMNEAVIPLGFPMSAYDAIFRSSESYATTFNGQKVMTQLKLPSSVPWLLLDAAAADSGYVPTEQEKTLLLNIITIQLPQATRNLLTGLSVSSFSSSVYPPNYSEMGLPSSYILGWWWDNPQTSVLGSASVPKTSTDDARRIAANDFSINTLQKIQEKFPSYSAEQVQNEFLTTALQMAGIMAGANEPYKESTDPGGLTAADSVFVTGTTARAYTQFDKDALYISYVRGYIASPDLDVSAGD
ncbi:MAG: hypothetical protein AB1656_11355 [Candidatus Omnitrophota bacterium]